MKRHSKTHDSRGLSLVFVASLGFIAVLAAMGLADSLVSAQRNVVNQVYMNEASSACENALQYTISVLNQAAMNQNLTSVGSTVNIPPQIAGAATVSVTITNCNPANPHLTTSPIYSNLTTATTLSQGTVTLPSDYRIITAQAQYLNFQRTINVLVGPNSYKANPTPSSETPFFSNALLAYGQLNINNGISVLTDNLSSHAATIASNQSIAIAQNPAKPTTIDGNINAYSSLASGLNLSSIPSTKLTVNGNVAYSGTAPTQLTADVAGQVLAPGANGANVLGSDALNGGAIAGTIAQTASLTPAAAPAPTVTATNGAQFSSGGNATTTSVSAPSATPDNQNPVVDLGSVNLTGPQAQTLILNPGVYSVSSLNIGANSTLQINIPSSAASGVQLYVQGNPTTPISINGSVTTVGAQSANNFQIFYNGSQPVNIAAAGKFYGEVYAPQSTTTVDTTHGDFHGSVVANALTLTGTGSNPGNFYYDPTTATPSQGGNGVAGAPGFALPSKIQSQSFNVLSWQEKTTGAP